MMYPDDLEMVLRKVQKPGRYVGGEWQSVVKNPDNVKAKVGLVFPDVYEIGMSYLGQKILYHVLNRHPSYLAERIYAPWIDMETELRKKNIPLFSLENQIPLWQFDLLGFSLLFELNYSNILTILDLGKIPFRAADRNLESPLICAGGPGAFNPEPVADVFDLFLLGDGEEAFLEILDTYVDIRHRTEERGVVLRKLAKVRGVYVPGFYTTFVPAHSSLLAVKPNPGFPKKIKKRVVASFDEESFPAEVVVPNIKTVFDRISVEVERGCPQRCRFCQARSLYFPPRIKDPGNVVDTTLRSVGLSGYEDCSLSALSVSDYPYFGQTIESLMDEFGESRISLSVSSLRPKGLSADLLDSITKVRKTGLTLVPEAGTERLRNVINKDIRDKEIWEAVNNAFTRGWRLLKLYFMIGLPTERDEDLEGIIHLVESIVKQGYAILRRAPQINLTISSFIPKPHTPFQWEKMEEEEILKEKYAFLKKRMRKYPFVVFKHHNLKSSILEAVFSRGDRRLAAVLSEAWRLGARFDSWDEHFRFSTWIEAFSACDLDFSLFLGSQDVRAVLPWDHIDTGIKKGHMREELAKAMRAEPTPNCLEADCDVCRGCTLWPLFEKIAPGAELHPTRVSSHFGEITEDTLRYRLFYSKSGKARFISHNDVINVIQRSFRRAGISVLHSEGYHPKMTMTYLPALPLGMEGKSEMLEFKSLHRYSEDAFVSRLNRFTPRGIKFHHLERLGPDAPTLNESLKEMVYSLDMNAFEVKKALQEFRSRSQLNDLDDVESASLMVKRWMNDNRERASKFTKIEVEPTGVVMSLPYSPEKSIRPQDVIVEIFGMEQPVFDMARERIVFRNV